VRACVCACVCVCVCVWINDECVQTELMMLFGTIDYFNWTSNEKMPRAAIELQFFAVLYLIVIFLLVLNFVLAIIVEAYVKLRTELVTMETEQEFFTDLQSSLTSTFLGLYYDWPNAKILGQLLTTWEAKNSVGHEELFDTKLFRCVKVCLLQWM